MDGGDAAIERLARHHTAFGWWLVVVSMALGTILEALHALKLGVYLDVSNETRRLLWTLAHAHGALLGLLHVAFATSLPRLPSLGEAGRRFASRALGAGSLLLPGGFLLGGVVVYEGDPGLGVLLAPVGALLVLAGAFVVARGARAPRGV